MKTIRNVLASIAVFALLAYGIQVAGNLIVDGNVCLEGSSVDANETCIAVTDPDGDRTWTIPNVSDTFAGLTAAQTFSSGVKTITSFFDFGGGSIELPNATSLPGTCSVGQVFFDSDATAGANLYGCTATDTWTALGGASSPQVTLFNFQIGNGASAAGTFNATTGTSCYMGGATVAVSGGLLAGGPQFTGNTTDDLLCRAPVIQANASLTNITVTIVFGESNNDTGNWVVDVEGQCLVTGEAISTWNSMTSFTVAGDASTTARAIPMKQTGIDISSFCAVDEALYIRFIENATSDTATGELIFNGATGYTN